MRRFKGFVQDIYNLVKSIYHIIKMDFERLNSVLQSALQQMGLDKKLKERQCLLLWDEVVGEKLASVSKAEDIKNGVLFVSAKDPIWGQEIFNFKGLIMQKLNARLGEDIVKDIKVKVKPVRKRRKKKVRGAKEEEKELEEGIIQMIDRMTAKLEDEKMRQLLRRVMINYYKAKQAQERK